MSVLGIDDWAYRKGLSYGTLLVNIETRKAIDLLEGRDGVALKKWLKQHPEVETVIRHKHYWRFRKMDRLRKNKSFF